MMRCRWRWTAWRFALGVLGAGAAGACGGDHVTQPVACDTYSGGNPSSASLVGGYELVSFCQGTKPALTPPAATGTLTLDAHTFNVAITVQGQQPLSFSGPYTVSGNTITVTLQLGQFTATYTFTGGMLDVSGTLASGAVSIVFHKTS